MLEGSEKEYSGRTRSPESGAANRAVARATREKLFTIESFVTINECLFFLFPFPFFPFLKTFSFLFFINNNLFDFFLSFLFNFYQLKKGVFF